MYGIDFLNNMKFVLSYLKGQDMTGFSDNNGDYVDCSSIKGPQTELIAQAKPNHASQTIVGLVASVYEADDGSGTNAQAISGATVTLTHTNGVQRIKFEKTKPYLQVRLSGGAGTATGAAVLAGFAGQAAKF